MLLLDHPKARKLVAAGNNGTMHDIDVFGRHRKAILSMIDVAGNAQRADFNKGPLKSNVALLKY